MNITMSLRRSTSLCLCIFAVSSCKTAPNARQAEIGGAQPHTPSSEDTARPQSQQTRELTGHSEDVVASSEPAQSSSANSKQTTKVDKAFRFSNSHGALPRINNIGQQSILTFDRKGSPLVISVEGFNLRDPGKPSSLSVHINGSVPITNDEYTWSWSKNFSDPTKDSVDLAEIKLNPIYVEKLKTGDHLEVLIGLRRTETIGKQSNERIAYAHRTFTVYDLEDYRRDVIPARVPAHDIQAFPLPEAESRYLFGPAISESFFVVRLTLRNSHGDDRLVNSGLISATGRAIVEPPSASDVTYTVPVKISPQGPTQVFAILDYREGQNARAWIFRSLEFVGALGTTAVTAFSGTPADLKSGVSIFTGVVMPESRKLWPDSWPGYKRNLVNFSMPELTKIPKQSTTSPKYLFFAKRDLELMVSDPSLFEKQWQFDGPSIKLHGRSVVSPKVRVISLAFDNLEIPFEAVTAPGETDAVELLGRVQVDNAKLIERLQSIQNGWSGGYFSRSVKFTELKSVQTKLANLAARLASADSERSNVQLKAAIDDLSILSAYLVNAENKSGGANEIFSQDFGLGSLGLKSATANRDELTLLMRRVIGNSTSIPLVERLDKINQQTKNGESSILFLEMAADGLANTSFAAAVDKLCEALPKDSDVSGDRQHVIALYETLKSFRTVKIASSFAKEEYDKIP
jgi:hypothetical protein